MTFDKIKSNFETLKEWTNQENHREGWVLKGLSNCGTGEDSWESLGLQGDQTSPSYRRSTLNIHWKDWCWSWSSNTLAAWCQEPTDWKRSWCWERPRARGEGDDWGWDGWIISLTQWTWDWASSRRWWRTGKPGMLQSMVSLTTEQLNNKWAL